MKLLILQLSDLHISGASNAVLQCPNEIAASAFHKVREATCCIIALTGDATFSSAADQFSLVSEFLSAIKRILFK